MKRAKGFTLIELMITVAIVAIISAVAYPSYIGYVQRTNVKSLQADLISAVADADAYRARNFTYTGWVVPANLSGSAKFTVTPTITSAGRVLTIRAVPKSSMSGSGALAIDSLGQNCHNTSSDTSCTLGTDTW